MGLVAFQKIAPLSSCLELGHLGLGCLGSGYFGSIECFVVGQGLPRPPALSRPKERVHWPYPRRNLAGSLSADFVGCLAIRSRGSRGSQSYIGLGIFKRSNLEVWEIFGNAASPRTSKGTMFCCSKCAATSRCLDSFCVSFPCRGRSVSACVHVCVFERGDE